MNNEKYKITFSHPYNKKGSRNTAVMVQNLQRGHVIATGYAECSPGDQFNKSIGRKLSLTRALETLPRNVRKEVWSLYWENVRS